jgi:hypothetical protein
VPVIGGGVVAGVDLPPESGSVISFRAAQNDYQPATKALIARVDPLPSEPGSSSTSSTRRVTGTPRPPLTARSEPLQPYPGLALVSTGRADPTTTRNTVFARSEPLPSHPGWIGSSSGPSPPSVLPGSRIASLVSSHPPPPFPGWAYSSRSPSVVPSPVRPIMAVSETPPPFPGQVIQVVVPRIDPRVRATSAVTLVSTERLPTHPGSVAITHGRFEQVRTVPAVIARSEPLPPPAGWAYGFKPPTVRPSGPPRNQMVGTEPPRPFAGWAYSAISPTSQPPLPPRPFVIYSEPLNQPGWVYSKAGPIFAPSPPPPPPYMGALSAVLSVSPQLTALFSLGGSPTACGPEGDC